MNDIQHIRESPTSPGKTEIVKCPYEWVIIQRPEDGFQSPQINRGAIVRQALELNAIICLGPWCAIYPCERVRDFAEGRI